MSPHRGFFLSAYCMVEGCNDFYIGHTICRLRDRCSGHRDSFKPGCYKKSALAYHIFNDHPEEFFLRASITLLLAF